MGAAGMTSQDLLRKDKSHVVPGLANLHPPGGSARQAGGETQTQGMGSLYVPGVFIRTRHTAIGSEHGYPALSLAM